MPYKNLFIQREFLERIQIDSKKCPPLEGGGPAFGKLSNDINLKELAGTGWIIEGIFENIYRIAGKFCGAKVWRIYSYKVLARKSLANG